MPQSCIKYQAEVKVHTILPLNILLDIFDTLIRPIFTYGSDVWGLIETGIDVVDQVFLNFVCFTLSVTTCNAIVYGECGRYPLSVFCNINVLLVCDLNRTPNCYGKTWRFLCPFFRNLHLRENLARDCFTSTVSTVTNSVQNIFTHLRYCDK